MTELSGRHTCATTCPYCGVGCGVIADAHQTDQLVIVGDVTHPANSGKLCVKGSTLADTQTNNGRLTQPLINGAEVSWDAAIGAVVDGFRSIIEAHGPDAVAFYLSGQLLTEDYYVANKLMKGFIGSANVDTNSRLCMASAVAAYKRAFGEDIVPCSYEDLDHCDLVVLVGSNAAWTHPILYQRIAARQAAGELKVIVVDPRRTATCEIADLHLPIKPGSDVALFNGLLSFLASRRITDLAFVEAHTSGIDECLRTANLSLADCATATGLAPHDLRSFFEQFAASANTVSFYSQGVNQSSQGTDKANAIINCHLLTGRLGKLGNGPFSITGQPNAMGGREVGGMANQLAAHMDFNEAHLDLVQRFWSAPAVAQKPGHKAVDMFQAVAAGEIKAIWIMGTNPVVSLPDSKGVRDALARCPLVVVSDCVADSETVRLADIALPAKGWGEKDGTVTNSERFISRQRAFSEAPGNARADWEIICAVAKGLGHHEAFGYRSSHQIFVEHAALTCFENQGERVLDLSDLAQLSASEYDQLEPTQWPARGRPFADCRFSTVDRRAKFIATQAIYPVQLPTPNHPFILNSGRIRDQWHTMTRTGNSQKLFAHRSEPFVELSQEDANTFDIAAGDLIELTNAGGRFRGIARLESSLRRGQVFVPIHWSSSFTGSGLSNVLFASHTDPLSGQPESKHGSVALRKVQVAQWLRVVSRTPLERTVLDAWSASLVYWCRIPSSTGAVYEAATTTSVETVIAQLEALTTTEHTISMTDTTEAGAERRLLAIADQQTCWLLTAASARTSLATASQLTDSLFADSTPLWRAIAAGPQRTGATGPMICTCFEVTQDEILSAIAAGADSTTELGDALRCGTNCGSCVPELNQLIAQRTTRASNQESPWQERSKVSISSSH